jgi:hypothetical protein
MKTFKDILEDVDTSEFKIKKWVDSTTGKTKTRKIRPHRIEFSASKIRGEPAQKDSGEDKGMKEETILEATVDTKKYSWGTMKTVHHGSSFSIPLHPEHHQAIAKLSDQQEHKFKDETGHHWTAKRSGDDVHFQGANNGGTTKVKHSDLKEEVMDEKLKPSMGAGEYITDFQKSDAPQFKGKSKEKKRTMAIAAYLSAKRDMKEETINELSTDMLSKYKTAASASAKAADASGDYAKGDKRFKGINKATNKQFANDLKKEAHQIAEREDDEYHASHTHRVHVTISKEDGTKEHRVATVNAREPSHAVRMALDHYKGQGYTVHAHKYLGESVKQMDEKEETMTQQSFKGFLTALTELTGKQKNIDKNKNGKVDAHDFKLLRKEESEQIDERMVADEEGIAKKLVAKHGRNVNAHDIKLAIHLHPEGYKTTHDRIANHVNRLLGKPVREETEQIEEKSDQAKQNKTMKNMMDASRGAKFKLNNPVPDAEPEHKTGQAHNKAIGRALRKEDKKEDPPFDGPYKKATPAKNSDGTAQSPMSRTRELAKQAMKKQMKEDIDRLFEKDDAEYDYEGEMAVTQLKTICRHAEALQTKLKPDTNLPEWVQSKITLATDYMQTAHDYLMTELGEETNPAEKAAKETAKANLSAKHATEKQALATKQAREKESMSESIDSEGNLTEAMISYSDFQSKMDAHRKAGSTIKDYKHSENKAHYTIVDSEGTERKITHTDKGVSMENLGKSEDSEAKKEAKAAAPATERRGRGRPAGSSSGARRHK